MMRTFPLGRPTALCLLGILLLLPACGERGGAGPQPQVLTTNDQDDRWLAYSPDGSHVAWWRQRYRRLGPHGG